MTNKEINLFYKDRNWITNVFIGGVILLLCPPIGWILAMGYRKAIGRAYVESVRQKNDLEWPKWSGNFISIFIDGIKVLSVIMTYLLPSFIVGWGIILWKNGVGSEQIFAIFVFVFSCILFIPVGLPVVIIWLCKYSWFVMSLWQCTLVLALFILGVFFIPSGFVRVSSGSGFVDALPFSGGYRIFFCKPLLYCKAWIISIICCFGVFILGPLVPFGIFWSYQYTVKLFTDVSLRCDND